MAFAVVTNNRRTGVKYPPQYTSVWVKPYWGSAWRYAPYLFPENSTEASAPSDSQATLHWTYGKYVNLWSDPGATLLPLNLENWHVQIVVHTIYGNFLGWVGVVVGESINEMGIDVATGLPRGEQTLECRGLEYLLERRVVAGTYVGHATDYAYLPRTRTFNDSSSRRESLAGNRSASRNTVSGTFLFSADDNKWSNFDIIEYLLAAFQPWYPFETTKGQVTYVSYRPQFILTGQTEGLKYIFETHRFNGRTIRECLNTLIDRKRGFGWKIATDGVGPIYIVVFSLSQYPVVGSGGVVPANRRQIDVPIHDDIFITAKYRISSTSQVDQIVVEGETPIRTMATLNFADGSLEPAWEPSLDAELLADPAWANYQALADELLTNYDAIKSSVFVEAYTPLITPLEFKTYAAANPGSVSFLLSLNVGEDAERILAGFNVLDSDGDGYLSQQDLLIFSPRNTYQLVSEEIRATDAYATVFSHFQVPKSWPWTGWSPAVSEDGTVDPAEPGPYLNHDTVFERWLPLMEPGISLGVELEYLEPFAIIEKRVRIREIVFDLADAGLAPYTLGAAQAVDPTITQGEFDDISASGFGFITWEDLYLALETNPAQWLQLDRAGALGFPDCSLRMGDSGMRVIIKSRTNHIFGLGHEMGGSFEVEPEWDYRSLLVTVFFETDVMPRCVFSVWNNVYEDKDGNLVTQASPIGRQIYIQVPQKEVWMAAPNTVTGLDGENLVFFNEGFPGILRDDTEDLRYIARLAYIWYGQQRASMDMRIANQLPFFQIGDLIRSSLSGYVSERIGTCVTSISRNYQDGTHEVTTGYAELDPVAFGGEMK